MSIPVLLIFSLLRSFQGDDAMSMNMGKVTMDLLQMNATPS